MASFITKDYSPSFTKFTTDSDAERHARIHSRGYRSRYWREPMKSMILAVGLVIAGAAVAQEGNVIREVVTPNGTCQVRVGYGHITAGGRCFPGDEVMTGIHQGDPLMIRCSRLEVTCRNSDDVTSEKTQE